jgi:hypothetical protein
MPANQRVPASRCPQGHASIAFCSYQARFTVVETPRKGDPGSQPPGIGGMSVLTHA